MTPLPKCAGKVLSEYYPKSGYAQGVAETETGRWMLIDGIWHHVSPAASMESKEDGSRRAES